MFEVEEFVNIDDRTLFQRWKKPLSLAILLFSIGWALRGALNDISLVHCPSPAPSKASNNLAVCASPTPPSCILCHADGKCRQSYSATCALFRTLLVKELGRDGRPFLLDPKTLDLTDHLNIWGWSMIEPLRRGRMGIKCIVGEAEPHYWVCSKVMVDPPVENVEDEVHEESENVVAE